MKWMFLASFLLSLPFSMPHLPQSDFAAVPSQVWWEIGYMIIFSTFLAYYLIPVGQQRIRPTLVSMYGYLQPIIAIAVAIWTGMDRLTFTKVLAALLVFTGVWVVNQSRAAKPTEH
jgi:drug/metabolite transporter (DMT)-like permease